MPTASRQSILDLWPHATTNEGQVVAVLKARGVPMTEDDITAVCALMSEADLDRSIAVLICAGSVTAELTHPEAKGEADKYTFRSVR
jgi:hypothetical protein